MHSALYLFRKSTIPRRNPPYHDEIHHTTTKYTVPRRNTPYHEEIHHTTTKYTIPRRITPYHESKWYWIKNDITFLCFDIKLSGVPVQNIKFIWHYKNDIYQKETDLKLCLNRWRLTLIQWHFYYIQYSECYVCIIFSSFKTQWIVFYQNGDICCCWLTSLSRILVPNLKHPQFLLSPFHSHVQQQQVFNCHLYYNRNNIEPCVCLTPFNEVS